MKMYRIEELYNNITSIFPLTPLAFDSEEWYIFLKNNVDDYIKVEFYYRFLLDSITRKDNYIDRILLKVKMYLISNEYRLSKLYETTKLEYNPLWNVDGTETITRNLRSGEEKNREFTDNTTSNIAYGGNDVTSEYNTAMNTSQEYLTSKTQLNHNTTDTSTSNVNDTEHHVLNGQEQETITNVRTGNIGVTKSTDLLQSQREIVDFNFLRIVSNEIVNLFTYTVF